MLLAGKLVYNTTVLVSGGSLNIEFDDTYTAALEDEKYGEVFIVYDEGIESYMVNAAFKKTGATKLNLTAPDGTTRTFELVISRDTYTVEEITEAGP